MKLHSTLVALLCAVICPLAAVAQGNPFDQTRTVYIFSVNHNMFLSDYQSPTPNTYCLQPYALSRVDAIPFEMTTIDAAKGECVLYSPYTEKYMSVPAGGSFVNASTEVAKRSVLTVKDATDGHKALYNGTTLLSPYKNGAIMLLVGFTANHQAAGWGKVEESLWDIVEAADLEDFLVAHGIDPESDPYADPKPLTSFETLCSTIREAENLLFLIEGGWRQKGDALLTSAEQFSSEFADVEEGADFYNLIDQDYSTIWHSDWHGTAPEDYHSFDVLLPEGCKLMNFYATYTGRVGANNCAPVEMNIYGGNISGEEILWENVPVITLARESGVGAFAGWGHSKDVAALSGKFTFETDRTFDALRFEAVVVASDEGEGMTPSFNYSEFQLYGAEWVEPTITDVDRDAVAELHDLLEAAYYLDKEVDPTEIVGSIREVLNALYPEAIHQPATDGGQRTTDRGLFYDLQGRQYVRQPKSGIYLSGRHIYLR